MARWLHVIGACVLLGTGSGIAFFMLMAHRSGRPSIIAHTAQVVVVADLVFTTTAVVMQPITGLLLATLLGWQLTEGWIVVSIILYGIIGLFWLPVVWIQIRLRDMARAAEANGKPLPPDYYRMFRIWFACGVPAFVAILGIVWLMLARPSIILLAQAEQLGSSQPMCSLDMARNRLSSTEFNRHNQALCDPRSASEHRSETHAVSFRQNRCRQILPSSSPRFQAT